MKMANVAGNASRKEEAMRKYVYFPLALAFAGLVSGCPNRGIPVSPDGGVAPDGGGGCETLCNGIDDDGDGLTDECCPGRDADGDGFAAPEDCDDTNVDVNPGETEVCTDREGKDEDCDGRANASDSECPDRTGPCGGATCREGQHCLADRCVDDECRVDSDCSDGFACTEEDCIDGTCDSAPDDRFCGRDWECNPSDRDADRDGCVFTGECADDGDCPDGQICEDGSCESGCRADADCDDGWDCTRDDCVRNVCVFEPDNRLCGDLEECNPDDRDANRAGCVFVGECNRDSDCATDEICESGLCERGCRVDADCSDVLFCNGTERCAAGDCRAGAPVVCDDGRADTSDSCSEAADRCEYVPVAVEVCDGLDNDADGLRDEGFACVLGTVQSCATACGSTGSQTCVAACVWGVCTPPAESCGNGRDDNCDGRADEGCAVELCTNVIDDDGDGLINEGCAEICGDGIDNDRDGLTDEGCGVATRRVVCAFTTEGGVVFDRVNVNGCYGIQRDGFFECEGPALDAAGHPTWGDPIPGCTAVDRNSVTCTLDALAGRRFRFNPHYYDLGGTQAYGCEGAPNRDRDEDPGTVTCTVDGVAVTFDDGDGVAEVRELVEVPTDFGGGCNLDITLP